MSEEDGIRDMIVADVVPKFEITLEEAEQRKKELDSFVQKQMAAGVDFGKIGGKRTLFKSGAEKLANIFGFFHELHCVEKIEDWKAGFFFYRYKCIVYHKKSGILQSEAFGSCNSNESAKQKQLGSSITVYDQVNSIDKIAQKRAYVAAVLSACRVSNWFTQDLEDVPQEKQVQSAVVKPKDYHEPSCVVCKKLISTKVADYSAKNYNGKVMCFDCQSKEKPSGMQNG